MVAMSTAALLAFGNPGAVPPTPWILIPLMLGFFLVVFRLLNSTLGRISGWALLARRFAREGSSTGETWRWQSVRMRGFVNYNRCVTLGADPQTFYMAVMWPFSISQPPLVIPWTEITVTTGKLFFGFYDTALLRLGRDEQVGVRVYGAMVERLRQAAGPGWPNYAAEQMVAGMKGR
jgi:hypothetical protein